MKSTELNSPEITVIVPFLNEQGTLQELHDRVESALSTTGKTFEMLLIDDGSSDGSLETALAISKADPRVRVFSLRKNCGKAAALQIGFEQAAGDYIFTMDADLQDAPEELPGLLEKLEEGWDMISGWKIKRNDPLSKTIPSKLFNWATSKIAGIRLHDFNCGLKLYRREVIKEIRIYGEMHRYIPVLANQRGFRVTEKPVQHYARKWGKTKYGASRLLKGLLDFLTVIFLQRYLRRPSHIFGGVGAVIGGIGFFVAVYLTILKICGQALGNRPLLLFSVLFILVGVQLISLGLLGEMLAAQQREERFPLRNLDDKK